MALPAHSGPRPLIQFRNNLLQSAELLGRVISPSQGRYIHRGQHKHRINARTDTHALCGIRTHDPSVRAKLRPAAKYKMWGTCSIDQDIRNAYNILVVEQIKHLGTNVGNEFNIRGWGRLILDGVDLSGHCRRKKGKAIHVTGRGDA
jgi:hypothetical protein